MKTVDTFTIEVRYSDQLREQIREESEDPLGWIDELRGGETVLLGGEDDPGMKEYVTSFFGGVLQSLAECIDGERSVYRTANGPVYVVLEPTARDSIRFCLCYSKESAFDPDVREPFEPCLSVRTDVLVEETLSTAEEFLDVVRAVEPNLITESNAYRGLAEDVESVRRTGFS